MRNSGQRAVSLLEAASLSPSALADRRKRALAEGFELTDSVEAEAGEDRREKARRSGEMGKFC